MAIVNGENADVFFGGGWDDKTMECFILGKKQHLNLTKSIFRCIINN